MFNPILMNQSAKLFKMKSLINQCFSYIKKRSKYPLHKLFGKSKSDYNDFIKDLYSDKPSLDNFLTLLDKYFESRTGYYTELYMSTYEPEEWNEFLGMFDE